MQPDELQNTLINDFWKRSADLTYHDDEIINFKGDLYHYTSSIGLLGILESQKLWATESSYLNDSQEIKYGINFVVGKLREIQTPESWIYDLVQQTISRVNKFHANSNIYLVCFCENGDLLSQWKGYTNLGDGYSIGFKASELIRTKRKFPHFGISIRKVIYDKREQERIINSEIEATLQKTSLLLSKYQAFQKDILQTATSYLFNYLSAQIVRFKSDVFQEEREWRAIYFDDDRYDGKRQKIKFRTSGNYIVPFVELDIAPSAQKEKWFLPIFEITIGAKINYPRAKKSIELISKNLSMQPPEIHPSDISLQ